MRHAAGDMELWRSLGDGLASCSQAYADDDSVERTEAEEK